MCADQQLHRPRSTLGDFVVSFSPNFPLVVALLLAVTTLSGCASNDAAPCGVVPTPAAGYEFGQLPQPQEPIQNGTMPLFTIAEGTGTRGDATVIDTLLIRTPLGGYAVDVANNSVIEFIHGDAHSTDLNVFGVGAQGPWIWGRCVRVGQTYSLPASTLAASIVVRILQADDETIRIEAERIELIAPGEAVGTIRYVSTFVDGQPIAYDMRVYSPSNDSTPSNHIVVPEQKGNVIDKTSRAQVPVDAAPPSLAQSPCTALPMRHPNLNGTDAEVPFADYLANMSRDTRLARYLEGHPSDCARISTFVRVRESGGEAYVWTSIFAGPTNDRYHKQFAVRCFDDAAMQLIYGQCVDMDHYSATTPRGKSTGDPVDEVLLRNEISLALLTARVQAISPRAVAGFAWHSTAVASPGSFLEPKLSVAAGDIMFVDVGSYAAEVNYARDQGRGLAAVHSSSLLVTGTSTGWILSFTDAAVSG